MWVHRLGFELSSFLVKSGSSLESSGVWALGRIVIHIGNDLTLTSLILSP